MIIFGYHPWQSAITKLLWNRIKWFCTDIIFYRVMQVTSDAKWPLTRSVFYERKYGIFLECLDQNFDKIQETRWLQKNRIDLLINFKQYWKNSMWHNLANYSSKPNQFQIIYWVMEPLFRPILETKAHHRV